MIKSVSDTDKLMALQAKLKSVTKEDEKITPTSVTNNALFVGSTAELQKMLKEASKDNK